MTPDDATTYQFFKAISANQRSYLCDFHKINYRPGRDAYRVVLQCFNQKDITVDLECVKNGAWHITDATDDIPAELEWKLITAIVEQANKPK